MTTGIVPTVCFDTTLFIPELKNRRFETVFGELVARAHRAGAVSEMKVLRDALLMRERIGSTYIGKGVAVPYARSIGVSESRLVVARSERGVEWSDAADDPVHLVLLVLSPAELGDEAHFGSVMRTASAARLQRNRQKLLDATNVESVTAVLREALA
jgi:fructose PTS system EIIA component